MWYDRLPHVNAFLNAASTVLLVWGYTAIRRGNAVLHERLMKRAFVSSSLFLASYLTYHIQAGRKTFPGEGWLRTAYLGILLSHTVLAVVTVPLVLTTLYFALRGRFDRHRRIARVTLPIWLYVSVTGVVVYWMLYRL